MPRQARKPSGTGIHHVMMRGINHQNIFEVVEDYYQLITTLDRVRVQYDDFGLPCGTNCTYYMTRTCPSSYTTTYSWLVEEIKKLANNIIQEERNKLVVANSGPRHLTED